MPTEVDLPIVLEPEVVPVKGEIIEINIDSVPTSPQQSQQSLRGTF